MIIDKLTFSIIEVALKHHTALWSLIHKRCLLEGCRYGVEGIDKNPADACIYCGTPRIPTDDEIVKEFRNFINETKTKNKK